MNRNIRNRLRAQIVPEPGASMLDTWVTAHTPCDEPLTHIMRDTCKLYERVYGESVG